MKVKDLMVKLAELDPEEVIYVFDIYDHLVAPYKVPIQSLQYAFDSRDRNDDGTLSDPVWFLSDQQP